MKNIPFQRQLLYVILTSLLPFVLVLVWFVQEKNKLDQMEQFFHLVNHQASMLSKKQAKNQQVIDYYRDADHFYIDKNLECLTFLEPEIEHLQGLLQGTIPVTDPLRKRFDFLTGGSNQLQFVEGQVHSLTHFQEVTETLTHPVEIDTSDLKKILSKIEGVFAYPHEAASHRPHMIITDFKIDKKETSKENEVFKLQLKLLKREYL